MQMTTLGNTGLKVSRLGAGLAAIGEELTLAEVDTAGRVSRPEYSRPEYSRPSIRAPLKERRQEGMERKCR